MIPESQYTWLICYINSAFIDRVEKELASSLEYKDVKVYIPTVRILKKVFKGKQCFEEVPLLFNYGFFKVPRKHAVFSTYLENMKKNISCIYAWVKDPSKVIKSYPRLRMDNHPVYTDNDIPLATATSEEISELVKAAYYSSVYSSEDLDTVKPGSMIVLRGYPFDNVQAEVIEVLSKKQKVRVRMNLMEMVREVTVSFDNVFFTIYHNHNYDDSLSTTDSLDLMADNKTLDKKLFKNQRNET